MSAIVKRKLTCIFCADVKSYTQLMEVDEARTLEKLKDYRGAMSALVTRHDGRMVNTWGDAVIVEFTSVVEAVQCAVEIQRELAGRNMELPEKQRMWFRIGINLGDVMIEGDDLYGEGVNIAARLQELAEPGGIAISGSVHEQVRNKLVIGFDYLGEQTVRNISEPIISYRVVLDRNWRPQDDGKAAPTSARAPDADAVERESGAAEARRPPISDLENKLWRWFQGFKFWYGTQTKLTRTMVGAIGGLFAINLLTGLSTPWFLWPAGIMGCIIYLRHRSANPADGPRDRR
jgi:adenylate cyclase